MRECKHNWIDSMTDLGVDERDLGACPNCEIDRLTAQLEIAREALDEISTVSPITSARRIAINALSRIGGKTKP